MKLFRKIGKVFRAYSDVDKAISFACIGLFFLMLLKMIIFPYGMFNFGEVDIYTEGLVGQNGFQNVNPLFVDYNYVDREVCSLVFSGLMKYDPNKQTIVEDMGTLTINASKTEYTFVLKDGLKWHDGKPLTASDVYFTFAQVVQDPSFPNEILKANFEGVTIEQLDEKTIRFKLDKPNVFFVSSLTTGIIPKHVLGDVPVMDLLQDPFNKMPVGSGSYEMVEPIKEFKDGRMQVTLKVNSDYYSNKPKLEQFRFIYYSTMKQLIDEVHAVNGIVKVYGEYANGLRDSGEFVLLPYELPQYMAVFVNMDSPKVQDSNIRIALGRSLNKVDLVSKLIDKIAIDTPILTLDPGKAVFQTNIDASNSVLLDAGYKYASSDSKYRTDASGASLKLKMITRDFPEDTQQALEIKIVSQYLKEKWAEIGIEVEISFLPVDKLNEMIMDRSYDLLLIGQTLGYSMDLYSYWHSSQVGANGLNLSNYKSFQVDSLIEDIRFTFDTDKRNEKLIQIAAKFAEDMPAIFLYKPVYYYASDGKVDWIDMKGLAFSSDRFAKIYNWEFSKK